MKLDEVAQVAPLNLQRILGSLGVCLASDQEVEKVAAVRESLGFMIRFFASVCSAAKAVLPPLKVWERWQPSDSVVESEQRLIRDLLYIRQIDDPLAQSLSSIFFSPFGQAKPFARHLGLDGETPRLAEVCLNLEEAQQGLKIIKPWLASSYAFFQECSYHYEPGENFGQRELAIDFRQYRLKTRFAVRLIEARGPAKRGGVGLAAPDYVATKELGQLVAGLLEDRRSETEEELAAIAEIELQPKPILEYRSEYLGFAKNEDGRLGHAGRIYITNGGEGELSGVARSDNPNLKLVPGTFRGDDSILTFWLDPGEMPHPEGYFTLKTNEESKVVAISSLVPPSRLSNLSLVQLCLLLLAPGAIGVTYIAWVYHTTIHRIHGALAQYAPELLASFLRGEQVASFRRGGVGVLELQILPRIESATLLLLLVSVLAPLVVTKLFRFYPRSEKRRLGWLYGVSLVSPTLSLLVFWSIGILWSPLLNHPELMPLDFRSHFVTFAVFNLVASIYLFLSVTGVLDRWIRPQVFRVLLSPALFLGWLVLVVVLVYARSWLAW